LDLFRSASPIAPKAYFFLEPLGAPSMRRGIEEKVSPCGLVPTVGQPCHEARSAEFFNTHKKAGSWFNASFALNEVSPSVGLLAKDAPT
jgi:hypothetical protein